jgi:hypothetical protein
LPYAPLRSILGHYPTDLTFQVGKKLCEKFDQLFCHLMYEGTKWS